MDIRRILTLIFYSLIVLMLAYAMGYLIWGGKDIYAGSSFALYTTYILLGIAIAVTFFAAIGNIIHHPKSGLKTLVGIGVLGLIGLIGYTLSDGEILYKYIGFGVDTAGQSKMIDAALYLLYGTIVIAIVSIVVAEINSLFKN